MSRQNANMGIWFFFSTVSMHLESVEHTSLSCFIKLIFMALWYLCIGGVWFLGINLFLHTFSRKMLIVNQIMGWNRVTVTLIQTESWNSNICFASSGYNLCDNKEFYFILFFNWSIVDLQCCVNFCHTAKWFSYAYIYILFYILFHMVHHRIMNVVPCAI